MARRQAGLPLGFSNNDSYLRVQRIRNTADLLVSTALRQPAKNHTSSFCATLFASGSVTTSARPAYATVQAPTIRDDVLSTPISGEKLKAVTLASNLYALRTLRCAGLSKLVVANRRHSHSR